MNPPELPSPYATIQNILDDVRNLEVESLALDYVEQALGRRYFQEHWERTTDEEHTRDVRAWLEEMRYDPDLADDVIVELKRLYVARAQWPR